jgi:hypothetical protein
VPLNRGATQQYPLSIIRCVHSLVVRIRTNLPLRIEQGRATKWLRKVVHWKPKTNFVFDIIAYSGLTNNNHIQDA